MNKQELDLKDIKYIKPENINKNRNILNIIILVLIND